MACSGLYALLKMEAVIIHFVFHTEHMMAQSKRDFDNYWMFT